MKIEMDFDEVFTCALIVVLLAAIVASGVNCRHLYDDAKPKAEAEHKP